MAVKTFYCQADCQSADWAHHKATCTKLRSRRTLRQAANVLQMSFWRIRRQAYPVAINKVDVVADSTDVTIHADHTDSKGAATSLHTLSIDLFKGDKELEKAILSHAAAADAVVCLHEMARELFSSELEEVSRVQSREEAANQTGLCWSLEEVTVFPTTDKLKVSTTGHPSPHVFYPETKANEQQLSLHFLYRLTLKTDKTVWAVDVTGAQHGFPDALCPWPTYARDHCNTVDRKTVQEAHEVGYLWNEWKNGPESEKWIGEALMAEVHKSLCETAAALGGELGRLGKPGIQKERLVALDRLEAAAGRAMMSVKEHGYRMGVIGEVTENCGVHDGDSEEIGEEEKDEKEDEGGIKRETSVQDSARLGRITQLEASLDAAASSMRIVATPLACLREAHELLRCWRTIRMTRTTISIQLSTTTLPSPSSLTSTPSRLPWPTATKRVPMFLHSVPACTTALPGLQTIRFTVAPMHGARVLLAFPSASAQTILRLGCGERIRLPAFVGQRMEGLLRV
ncbi:hypothetical protein CMQ_3492 [Grosmannia clavigera kw1407]|uniref:Suppressor of anucleate metulae protein B n=1 Tax=Grosmannia clavigera (strain kw1407 / UAMH 11150) TaxID=655863 RepID=F0X8S3_GROCL|nr:uncharacterized protein CMQ_3492 [Grosmannia clavigera kw1407]EFX05423.1 hypothetical protein CMQ_3492 [Grosmannia clavigera kw1407]